MSGVRISGDNGMDQNKKSGDICKAQTVQYWLPHINFPWWVGQRTKRAMWFALKDKKPFLSVLKQQSFLRLSLQKLGLTRVYFFSSWTSEGLTWKRSISSKIWPLLPQNKTKCQRTWPLIWINTYYQSDSFLEHKFPSEHKEALSSIWIYSSASSSLWYTTAQLNLAGSLYEFTLLWLEYTKKKW